MVSKPQILTVDRNKRNLELLAQFLAKEGYQTLSVSSIEEFDQVLSQEIRFTVALIDISGFDRTIWEYCEKLAGQNIQLLIISPQQSANIRQMSFEYGAQGVLVKPLVVQELISFLRSMLKDESDE